MRLLDLMIWVITLGCVGVAAWGIWAIYSDAIIFWLLVLKEWLT